MLSAADLAATSAALARARAGAEEAARLAAGAGGWWTSIIGADSTAAAVRANAKAARTLYETLRAKLDRWRSSSEPVSAAEVASFLDAAGVAADNRASAAAAEFVSVSGAVREVGGETLRDLASPSRWPSVAWVLVAVVVVAVLAPFVPLLVVGRARA